MFQTYFSQYVDPSLEFETFEVLQGELPQDAERCDAYLITGSKYSVYEDEPWIAALLGFIKSSYQAQVPMIGICFGHQAIAYALGGKVTKAESGWRIGMQRYEMLESTPWAPDERGCFRLLASHQDQVDTLPLEAINFVRGECSPHAGFYISDHVVTLQSHPEFDQEFLRFILNRRRSSFESSYATAVKSLEESADKALIGGLFRQFLAHQSMLRNQMSHTTK